MDEFERSILLLENDLEAMGWDEPARLYAILGTPGDYHLEKMTDVHGHPVDAMRLMARMGPLRPDVMGIALAYEAWRHATIEELKTEGSPEWALLYESAEEMGVPREDIDKLIEIQYERLCMTYRPTDSPHRREVRSVQVLMRDGASLMVSRDRGGEPEVEHTTPEGRLIEAMQSMLRGHVKVDADDL